MRTRGGNTTIPRLQIGVSPRSVLQFAFDSVTLPDELKGKSAEEVAAFYQNMVQTQKATYEAALQAFNVGDEGGGGSPPPTEPPKPTMSEFLADPTKHTEDLIKKTSVTRTEWDAATKQVQESLIYIAEQRAREAIKTAEEKSGGSFIWDRFQDDILKVVNSCDPYSRTSPSTWTAAYYYVAGIKRSSLTKEAVTAATTPMEQVQPGGNEPPTPKPLTSEERIVAEGLGLSDDSFRKGREHMVKQRFPLTTDNRARR